MGLKKIRVANQTGVLDENTGRNYLETNLPTISNIPFAYRDDLRVGWNNEFEFQEGANFNTWRIYFKSTPSGSYSGTLYYATK